MSLLYVMHNHYAWDHSQEAVLTEKTSITKLHDDHGGQSLGLGRMYFFFEHTNHNYYELGLFF